MPVYGVNWAKAFNAGAMRRALEKGYGNLAMSKNREQSYIIFIPRSENMRHNMDL
jgi:hypothetical protein